MSSMDIHAKYSCPVCIRVELNSYEGWLWHLGSREHQIGHKRTSEPFFNPRANKGEIFKRCVDVHEIFGLKARELLEYFKTWGQIEDFSYWYKNGGEDGKAVRCVCLYQDKESAEACINEEEHKLDGKMLRVSAYKSGPKRFDDKGKEGRGGRINGSGGGEKRKSEEGHYGGRAAFKKSRYYD